jgi:hypothetical protein
MYVNIVRGLLQVPSRRTRTPRKMIDPNPTCSHATGLVNFADKLTVLELPLLIVRLAIVTYIAGPESQITIFFGAGCRQAPIFVVRNVRYHEGELRFWSGGLPAVGGTEGWPVGALEGELVGILEGAVVGLSKGTIPTVVVLVPRKGLTRESLKAFPTARSQLQGLLLRLGSRNLRSSHQSHVPAIPYTRVSE